MKKIILFNLAVFLACFSIQSATAASFASQYSGKILYQEAKNELWYVEPTKNQRYLLSSASQSLKVPEKFVNKLNRVDWQKIAQAGMPVAGDKVLAKKLAGKIYKTEDSSDLWYIHPQDLKRYNLNSGTVNISDDLKKASIKIDQENLARIHKPELYESINQYSKYEQTTIKVANGKSFKIDYLEIDLANPKLKIITDTADDYNCLAKCQAKTLAKFVKENGAFAGMNGTYFDTSAAKLNYYFFPVYNTNKKVFLNEDKLKWWTTGPLMVFDTTNKFYYFKDSREFKSVAAFEAKYGVKIQAALGNKPRLTENYLNYLIDWELDNAQTNSKVLRNALGYKNNKLYLVIARSATVPDLGDIMTAMGMEYALNLDGGYSSALYYNDEYMVDPGRNIPNVILFKEE